MPRHAVVGEAGAEGATASAPMAAAYTIGTTAAVTRRSLTRWKEITPKVIGPTVVRAQAMAYT